MTDMSEFAHAITQLKYAHTLGEGKETWENIAYRATKHPMKAIGYTMRDGLSQDICKAIGWRKFMPAGRYLYASGRPYHQVQNCYSSETRVVTRDGTFEIKDLVGTSPTLMTTKGHWIKSQVVECGRQRLFKVSISFGKTFKCLYATAEHSWRLRRNNRKVNSDTSLLRPGDTLWSTYGYGISRTPVNPAGIRHGLVFGDGNVPKDTHGFNTANLRLCGKKNTQLIHLFQEYPTRPILDDIEVSGLPRHYKEAPSLRWCRSYLLGWLVGYFAADGCVSKEGAVTLSSTNRSNLQIVKDVAYLLGIGVNSIRYTDRISNLTGKPSILYSVSFDSHTLIEGFFICEKHKQHFIDNPPKRRCRWKVASVEQTDRVETVYCAVVPHLHEFVLEDNILTGNCTLLGVHDSREGWSDLLHKASMALMTGAGIGVEYSDIRHEGAIIRRTGGKATGPLALMQMLNECGRGIQQGGSRRSAIWAGLRWDHADIFKFIHIKDWSDAVKELKKLDFNFPATLDCTNISVGLNDEFFMAYKDDEHPKHTLAHSVYWDVIKQMLTTGEPGLSINTGKNSLEIYRNACTEVSSKDTDDICNLGSINLARVDTIDEFESLVEMGTVYLLAGTMYSDVPYSDIDRVRSKNRRLGLGLMGVHEWLLKRGKPYAPDHELWQWLQIYQKSTKIAREWADELGISRPVKTRAIAPTGTISIVAETTSGIEPIFCVAYKRRYLKGSVWHYQYVVDPTAARLIKSGVSPNQIEDAYDLSWDVERRVEFQHWMQQSVDHGISSTINLPHWGSEQNNDSTVRPFGEMLMKYLPELRGITCYPDGARDGQPLVPVTYKEAMEHTGEELTEEAADVCSITKGGSCGD